MSKLGQIKAIKTSGELQQLLDSACKILLNPIAMFDTNYSLIAYTDVETDDPLWNELTSTGTFSIETQGFFASEYFTYEVSNMHKLVVLKSEELKYDRVLANVVNRDHIKVANLVMVACNTEFDADDLVALSAFADKITRKICNDEHFTAYGKSYHNDLIVKLIEGEIKDTRIYAPHIQILYDGFKNFLYLAVVDTGQSSAQNDKLVYFRDLLMERFKQYKFAIYSSYIVMIMSSNQKKFNKSKVFGKYNEFLTENHLFAGVSSGFENLYELHNYYEEAVEALKSDTEESSDQHVFLYDC